MMQWKSPTQERIVRAEMAAACAVAIQASALWRPEEGEKQDDLLRLINEFSMGNDRVATKAACVIVAAAQSS